MKFYAVKILLCSFMPFYIIYLILWLFSIIISLHLNNLKNSYNLVYINKGPNTELCATPEVAQNVLEVGQLDKSSDTR